MVAFSPVGCVEVAVAAAGEDSVKPPSMGILFLPLLIGLILLFYNAKLRAGWVLFYVGIAILVVEILSSIRFYTNMKTSHLLLMFVAFAAGVGLMLRSYKEVPEPMQEGRIPPPPPQPPRDQQAGE